MLPTVGRTLPVHDEQIISQKQPIGPPKFDVVLGQNLRETLGIENCPVVRCAADIAAVFDPLAGLAREVMIAGSLDCQCRLVFCNLVTVGSSDGMVFRIADVFFGAVKAVAPSLFLVHNHPSGHLTPSRFDWEMTGSVSRAAKIMGIAFVDHVIISSYGYHSLMENPKTPKIATPGMFARAADSAVGGSFCNSLGLTHRPALKQPTCSGRRKHAKRRK